MPEHLIATPGQTIGPFFHDALPYPRGNELVASKKAGAIRLHGTVYDGAGQPVPDGLLEIRQADAQGTVPLVEGSLVRDGRFTGWGRAPTDSAGRYWFRTVEPPAFFSVAILARGLLNRLFTRAYIPGADLPADPLIAQLDSERRRTLMASRQPDGNLCFDIHLQGDRETVFLFYPGHGDR